MTDTENANFSYEVFDRQLESFCRMLNVLIEAWDDYSPQELTFDIRSLCIKANRLCHMAEQDMVLQHNDLTKHRKENNEKYEVTLSIVVLDEFTPLMSRVIQETRAGHLLEGNRTKTMPLDISQLLPKLYGFLSTEDQDKSKLVDVQEVIEIQKELARQVKPTHIAGVKPVERLWNLFQLYSMACYLLFHFRKVSNFSLKSKNEEQTARIFEMTLQKYQEEPKGMMEIEKYFTTLEYDNNGKSLTINQYLAARKDLKNDVPENLRLCFMKYVKDTTQLGAALNHISFTPEEYLKLVSATVKWHIIEQEIYDIEHPEGVPQVLENGVFYTVKDGKYIDMVKLKNEIAKMVELVTRKNHWFCVWCVLKHHNLLKDKQNFSAFAHQMMSPDWFGDIDEYLHFSGDTLRDYRRYFSEIDFADWNEEDFKEKKEIFHMTKWSDKLLDKFLNICKAMNGKVDMAI